MQIFNEDIFPHVKEYEIVLVGTNTYCSLAQGFQRDVMLHYPEVQKKNMTTRYGDKNKLGTILPCESEGITFVLCFICEGNFRPDLKKEYLDANALKKCLSLCNIRYAGKKLAMTVMGASRFDGNGDKEAILKLIEGTLTKCEVDVYDYHQTSKEERKKAIRQKELEVKSKDILAYYKMVKERKEIENKIKLKNGHTRT